MIEYNDIEKRNKDNNKKSGPHDIFLGILIVVGCFGILSFISMFLWNYIILNLGIFNLRVTFKVACAAMALLWVIVVPLRMFTNPVLNSSPANKDNSNA